MIRGTAAASIGFVFEHDLVGKPVPTFPDHARSQSQTHTSATLAAQATASATASVNCVRPQKV
jgi:hypothetical protein